jgi:hypothetical protein
MWVWNGCRYGLRCDMPPNAPLSSYPSYFGPFLGGGQQTQSTPHKKKKKKTEQTMQIRTDL